ncbi:hypothetical protein [Collimonas sp.]|uniref:hypothetical protein n=1 Tax=Collimonas sp. TaxID=1963772 RepID=UPI002C54BB36|nr:hypothetical protein [Collimonas sp.]HWW06331.1 hypothetical protein [Collimonas sp.]
MKDHTETVTIDLLGAKRPRGQPPTGCAMTAAERKRLQRERAGLVTFTVELPEDLVEQFNEFLRFKDLTKSAVIEKLIRSQLLRKR